MKLTETDQVVKVIEQWPSGQRAGFPVQRFWDQNHWVVPRTT